MNTSIDIATFFAEAHADMSPQTRRACVIAFARTVRQLHEHGIHLKGGVFQALSLEISSAGDVHVAGCAEPPKLRPLAAGLRLHDVAYVGAVFFPASRKTDRLRFLRAYAPEEYSRLQLRSRHAALETALFQEAALLWRARERAVSVSYFRRMGRYRVCHAADPDGEKVLRYLLPDPASILAAAERLHGRGRNSSTYRFQLDGRSYFVKQYIASSQQECLKNIFRGSRALRNWRLSTGFSLRGLSVPRPVAMIQERRRYARYSYMVTEFIEQGVSFRAAWAPLDAQQKKDLLVRAALLFGKLHACGVLHGDSHWDNIIVVPGMAGPKLYLIDIDGGRFYSSLSVDRMQHDLYHFLRDLFCQEDFTPALRLLFIRSWWHTLPTLLKQGQDMPTQIPVSLSSRRRQLMNHTIRRSFSRCLGLARPMPNEISLVMVNCVELIASAMSNGNNVLVMGSEGATAAAQHFAAELMGGLSVKRRVLPVVLLTGGATVPAVGGGSEWEQSLSRKVEGLAQNGDVVVCISAGDECGALQHVLQEAQGAGCKTVALLGNGGGKASRALDISLAVPEELHSRSHEVQHVIVHLLADGVKNVLFGDDDYRARPAVPWPAYGDQGEMLP